MPAMTSCVCVRFESKGAAPLLFHLKALAKPEEFWPIIEREIAARNFFLYCQSAVAEEREWVRRERAAVEAAGRERPIRVDSIRVDSGDLDFTRLDAFLAKTRIFPSFSDEDLEVVRPFLLAMERSGFQVFLPKEIRLGENWKDVIHQEVEATARHGWVVFFITPQSIRSARSYYEIEVAAELGASIIPVVLEKFELPPKLEGLQFFDASVDPATAPDRLVELLLSRPF
jgi:hypothetical protein